MKMLHTEEIYLAFNKNLAPFEKKMTGEVT
jgi:hypothetical protein